MINASVQRRTLFLLELLIFFMSVGEGMTAPAIPLLGEKLGASYSFIGFFMTGYSLAYASMTVAAGRLSDRLGRKKVLLFSLVIAVLASTGYYLASTAWSLLLFRTLEGMSRGILWPVAGALIADHTSSVDRNLAAGRFSAAYGLGVALGNLAGGYLMQFTSLRTVFPFYPLLSVGVFFLVLQCFKIESAKGKAEAEKTLEARSFAWQEIKKIWPVCYVGFAYSGFLYSLAGLLSLVAAYYDVSYLGIGMIFALFWCCRLVAFLGAVWASEKIGRKIVLVAGIAIAALAALIFVMANQFMFLALAAVLGGIGTGIMYPLSIALIADSASPDYRGFDMGFWEFTAALGMIMQTALAGILGQMRGVQLTYLFALVVSLIAVVIAAVFIKESPPHTADAQHAVG